MSRVTILGAGAWGSALAATAVRAHQQVCLWRRNFEKLRLLERADWAKDVTFSYSLSKALEGADVLIFALPAQAVRSFLEDHTLPHCPLIFACKGLEVDTGLLVSEVCDELGLPNPVGFLGGPHLAREVLEGLPTAGTLGTLSQEMGELMASALKHPGFQISLSSDPLGVQVVGALKNVFAILGGLILGSNLGENARSAFLTQGFAEMNLFGQWIGAEERTLWSQAGLGDFMLTCLSLHSRNTQFGLRWARGDNPSPYAPLAEGFFTIQAIQKRACKNGLRLSLVERLSDILKSPEPSPLFINALMECLS